MGEPGRKERGPERVFDKDKANAVYIISLKQNDKLMKESKLVIMK